MSLNYAQLTHFLTRSVFIFSLFSMPLFLYSSLFNPSTLKLAFLPSFIPSLPRSIPPPPSLIRLPLFSWIFAHLIHRLLALYSLLATYSIFLHFHSLLLHSLVQSQSPATNTIKTDVDWLIRYTHVQNEVSLIYSVLPKIWLW